MQGPRRGGSHPRYSAIKCLHIQPAHKMVPTTPHISLFFQFNFFLTKTTKGCRYCRTKERASKYIGKRQI